MSGNQHRLRKYQRKKLNAVKDKAKFIRLSNLYWRYWHKIYGGHELLWR